MSVVERRKEGVVREKATNTRHRRFLGLTIVAIFALAVDLVTKMVAVDTLSKPRSFGPAALSLTENRGVSFGLGSGVPTLLLVLATAAVAIAIAYLSVSREGLGYVPAGLIAGGAFGNVGDRIGDGAVTDFIDIGWWPVFNLADVFIVSGVALLLVAAFRSQA